MWFEDEAVCRLSAKATARKHESVEDWHVNKKRNVIAQSPELFE